MLWKTLKGKAYKFVLDYPDHPMSLNIYAQAKEARMLTQKYLLGLGTGDIEMLRQLLPKVFPKKLRKGALVISKNSLGAWRVDPMDQKPVTLVILDSN